MTQADQIESLTDVLADVTRLWATAAQTRHSPFHTPIVCTVNDDAPAPRIMVLRAASHDGTRFRFHTDARSPKVTHLGDGGKIALLAYDPALRVQLTVRGQGWVFQDGEDVETAWSQSTLSSRRCYLAGHAPGTAVQSAISGLPEQLLNRSPTETESLSGRPNFSVVMVGADELEWLKLTSCGNKRAIFRRSEDAQADYPWAGQWITP